MSVPDKDSLQRKMMGVLLHHVRVRAGRSQAELAAALHVSRNRYAQYELGQNEITLPELEVVAQQCGVALGLFFDDQVTVDDDAGELPAITLTRLQRKMLGIRMREARQCADKSQKECAAALQVSARTFAQYEHGEKEIPQDQLQVLASFLGVPAGHWAIQTPPA
jgi:transcriptional regulator with XRE-family HTH domain